MMSDSSLAHEPLKFPIYIIAGGRSSRFGSDKARALLHAKPLIRHVADPLSPIASPLIVVAERAAKYENLGLETIADIEPSLGPVGGLYTALHHLSPSSDWLFFLPCDFVGFQVEWIFELFRQRQPQDVVLAFHGQRWEPLFAFYHRSISSKVERFIQQGGRAMWRLLEELDARPLAPPQHWNRAVSLNTHQALLDFQKKY